MTQLTRSAFMLVLLAACDEGCPKVKRCDIRKSDCQQSVMAAVSCMRGGSSEDLPPVSVITEDEYLERVASYDDPEQQAEQEAQSALLYRGLALFDLAPANYEVEDARSERAKHIGAAYFPKEQDIVVIDRGKSLSDDGSVELLAHELVHALQDRDLDLVDFQERWGTSFDASLAVRALIEGEATHYQLLVNLALSDLDPDDVDWESFYSEWRSEVLLEAEEDAAPVALASVRFPYAFGGGFVSQYWLALGRAGIDELFEHPPRSTSEVLFGSTKRALSAGRKALDARAVPVLDDSFDELSNTTFGSWIARVRLGRTQVPVSSRAQIAEDLEADVFSMFHDPQSDSVIAAWRLRLVPSASLGEWPSPVGDHVAVLADEANHEVAILASESGLPANLDTLAWRAPQEDEEEDDTMSAAVGGRGHDLSQVPHHTHLACALSRTPVPRLK